MAEVSKRVYDVPEDELNEYQEAFNLFDKDGSGSISPKEFIKVLKNLGQKISNEEADQIIKELDHDNSGEIDFDEFVSYMVKVRVKTEENEEDEIIKAFQTFDVDKDDYISNQEFRHILCNIGTDRFTQDECDEIFKEADLDNDGRLNYREFVAFWRSR